MILALLACADLGAVDQGYAVPPCDAWSAIPLDGGRLSTCSDARVVVRYDGAAVEPVLDRWRTALLADGWRITLDNSAPGVVALALLRDGEHAVLGISMADGATWATVAYR